MPELCYNFLLVLERTPAMNPPRLAHWLQNSVATMGGGGIFLAAFLDSSVLSFPFVTDALVIDLSLHRPARMPYYCAMAALGSLAGCIWLYLLAKKGGEAFFQRHAGNRAEKAKRWVQRNAFLSVFIPGIMPPPSPFKVFVLAEGVFQVPLRTFVFAILLSRTLRYFAEGVLSVRYGERALRVLMAHSGLFGLSILVVLLLLYVGARWLFRDSSAGG
jgi:membrane protein YqaA with SNARE-associated domain